MESVICRFSAYGFEFEIFGQPISPTEQYGYLHMLSEYRLLAWSEVLTGRAKAREEIRKAKRSGEKTEPAFAKYFGLTGDPYLKLAELADASDEELRAIVTGRAQPTV